MGETRHVVMFSGGVGSWATARRVIRQYGRHAVTLLFTDTLCEDADLYRFLIESAAQLTGRAGVTEVSGLVQRAAQTPPVWERDARKAHLRTLRDECRTVLPQLVWLADGRDVWDVFRHHRYIARNSVGICTDRLKGQITERWLAANCDPRTTRCYVGIDWTESHRYYGSSYRTLAEKRDRESQGLRRKMAAKGWRYRAPLCAPPYRSKPMILDELAAAGIAPPRLYALGFAHNNCGGICVKAGHGHYALLLRQMPEVYAHAEREENALRDLLGDVSMLKDRRGGQARPLSLTQLRRRIENEEPVDLFDVGGCGCFTDTEAA